MIGPSASGSENGRPTSMTSAPLCATPRMSASERSRSGCPAVTYTTSARRPSAFSRANRCAKTSDEVICDADAIAFRVRDLDDRSSVRAGCVLLVQVGDEARKEHVSLLVTDDLDDRP